MIEDKHKVAVLARMAFEHEMREMISPVVYERLKSDGLIIYSNSQTPDTPSITRAGIDWLRATLG